MEVEGAPRGREEANRQAQSDLRRRRARRLGEVLPLLRRRARTGRASPRTTSWASTSSFFRSGTRRDIPLHVDGASGAFVWPFVYPDSEWDFRLEQVQSINASGHKFGLVYPGIGWLIFRSKDSLPEDLIFYEDYLGKRDATFTLNFSTGSAMVLAQYYNFIRFGHSGYGYLMGEMKENSDRLAKSILDIGEFELVGEGERLPLVAFRLTGEQPYDEFDLASQLAAERGWLVPPTTCLRTRTR